jgi:PKD repeat protein
MEECDLVLNSDMKWSTEDSTPSGYYDVETITLHEMGHWLNLRDLYGNYGDGEYDMAKVMYGFGSTGKNKRNLHSDDRDGIIYIYGASIPPESSFNYEPKLIYVGDEVSFYSSSKYNPSQWWWDFGDGETSAVQNPKHKFYSSGVHKVKLLTSNSYGTSEITKNVVVLPKTKIPNLNSPKNFNYIIPASAKAFGQNQTNWLTDLSILNQNSEAIYVYAFFLMSGGDNTYANGIEILIPSLKMQKFSDVLYNLFSQSNNFGGIYFTSDSKFFISSRTYNDLGDEGTYGQFIPPINLDNFLKENEEGYLLNLIQNKNFRTNVGFVNFSSVVSNFNLNFYKEGGILIGTIPLSLKPFSHIQLLSPIASLTNEEVENCYAVISQITPSTRITGYASIVDNNSSDPIFVPMKKIEEIEGRKHQIVPVIAKAKGAYGTNWRSDLKIFNPYQAQNILFKFYTSNGVYEATKTINQNSLISYNDIVSSLFPSAPENVSGSLHIYTDNGLFLTSRTYNFVEGKTYGQFIPGVGEDYSITQNSTGILLPLTYNESYRSNIGFTEFSGVSSEVQIKLYDKNRTLLGFKNYSIGAFLNLQISNVFQDLGISNYYEASYIEIKLVKGNNVYAYASVVDNRTGDSIFIPFLK